MGWYANLGVLNINDPDSVQPHSRLYFSGLLHAQEIDLKEETMVFEAHILSVPCTELNYAQGNTVFHSMAPLSLHVMLIL